MDTFRRRLLELSGILTDEEAAYAYLLQRLQKMGMLRCGKCDFDSFYVLSRSRLKCRRCRWEFRPLVATAFSVLNVPLSTWLSIVNYWVAEVPARQAAARCNLNYKTGLRAYTLIRHAVLGPQLHGTADDVQAKDYPAIGVLDKVEYGEARLLDAAQGEAVLKSDLARVRKGKILYTEPWQEYDTVVAFVDRGRRRQRRAKWADAVYVDYLQGFWQYAKGYLLGNRAINRGNIFIVIKELEWRYNNRDADQFELIVEGLLAASMGRGKTRPMRPEVTTTN
jgi:transposase-like protein